MNAVRKVLSDSHKSLPLARTRCFSPDVERNLRSVLIDVPAVTKACVSFGPLPRRGDNGLAYKLMHVTQHYRQRCLQIRLPRPFEERRRIARSRKIAEQLLRELGTEGAADTAYLGFWPIAFRLYGSASETAIERRKMDPHAELLRPIIMLISLLQDFVTAARRSEDELGRQSSKRRLRSSRQGSTATGRGGPMRQGVSSQTELVSMLIQIYADLRTDFPKSGPAPACDDALRRFVRAGLDVVAIALPTFIGPKSIRPNSLNLARITDSAIRGVFDRWRAQIKKRERIDLNVAKSKN